jgi:hypothetical protein
MCRDGGPVAELGLLLFTAGGASVAHVQVWSDIGSESSSAMAQTPRLEGSDEGSIAVSDRHNRIFSPLVENVINYGNTFGPEEPGEDSSKLLDVTLRHVEYFSASTALPINGYAGLPTAVGSVATIWQAETTFKQAMNITRLAFLRQDTPPPVGQVFVLHGDSSVNPGYFSTINTSALTAPAGFRISRGGWWAVYSVLDSNSHIFFVNGAAVDISVQNPGKGGSWFAVTRSSLGPSVEPRWPAGLKGVPAGAQYKVELVQYGVSLLSTVSSAADMLAQMRALVAPSGLRVVRGKEASIAHRSHGLLDLVADVDCSCAELSVDQNLADAHAMLPLRVAGLCANWTTGYFQKEGYSLGNYGNTIAGMPSGKNRYSALSMDNAASVHVPLYTGLHKHDVVVGHPVTLTLTQPSSAAAAVHPCDVFVQVSHVDSVPGVSDLWHVSVQNPTQHAMTITLHTAMGLPHFRLGGGSGSVNSAVVTVAPGQMVDVM